ncbi:HAD family hydrolase [Microbacterium oxydans]|uniref:HAD family hydrolase n=1 Tax=Microbacterium oxydans TaxID=82380 RepID=UPI00226B5BB5|nr:HAD family phosphatase [Microbacterium oxydans]WAA67713.1 HAD family phosphatase [Microbacterium oxydans]
MTPSTPSAHDRRSGWPSAVLFDLDGTLVDSERLWLDAIRSRLESIGAPASSEVLAGFEGLATIDAARALSRVVGLSAHESLVAAELEDLTIGAFAGRLPWIPGAEEALGRLRREGMPLALVTSSTRRWVDAVGESVHLGAFDAVVTADDVQQTKPHPEPYLRAAALLGVDPAACLVFEDSAVGVRAATAAGCRVVQVRSDDHDASRPTARIPDLRAVTGPWVASLRADAPALP